MKVVRFVASTLVWLLAALGAVSVLLWVGGRLGVVQPLVVVSGSMEPQIATGDLLIDIARDTSDLVVGEVISAESAVKETLVTHRVVDVVQTAPERWEVRLRGDGNDTVDAEVYELGPTVLQPAVRVPWAGYAVSRLTTPAVAVPLLIALGALLGLSLLRDDSGPRRSGQESEDDGGQADPRTDAEVGT